MDPQKKLTNFNNLCNFKKFRENFPRPNNRTFGKTSNYDWKNIISFLNERFQKFNVNGVFQDWKGVPHGTELGPLLLNLYINHIVSAMGVLWYIIQTIAWCMSYLYL